MLWLEILKSFVADQSVLGVAVACYVECCLRLFTIPWETMRRQAQL
jgi:hypothetical protein